MDFRKHDMAYLFMGMDGTYSAEEVPARNLEKTLSEILRIRTGAATEIPTATAATQANERLEAGSKLHAFMTARHAAINIG